MGFLVVYSGCSFTQSSIGELNIEWQLAGDALSQTHAITQINIVSSAVTITRVGTLHVYITACLLLCYQSVSLSIFRLFSVHTYNSHNLSLEPCLRWSGAPPPDATRLLNPDWVYWHRVTVPIYSVFLTSPSEGIHFYSIISPCRNLWGKLQGNFVMQSAVGK